MAEYLASIFGTEKDKVNCSFYFKIGACRHGDRCSRIHNKPTFSQTVLLMNLYQNPANLAKAIDPATKQVWSETDIQKHFDEFFEEVYAELNERYGQIEEMNVCDNLGDHLTGNVYVKFHSEEDSEKAVNAINNRWFDGRPMYAELSPVTDFREACCRQYEMGECTRGGFCNFMHLRPISRELRKKLFGTRRAGAGGGGYHTRLRTELEAEGGGGGGGGRHDRRNDYGGGGDDHHGGGRRDKFDRGYRGGGGGDRDRGGGGRRDYGQRDRGDFRDDRRRNGGDDDRRRGGGR